MKKLFTLLFLVFAVDAQATTYWTSPSAVSTTLSTCDGDADPSSYCTMASILSGMAAGDTIKGKAGTYTTRPQDNPLPSGISTSQRTTFDCETAADPPNGTAPVCILAPTGTSVEILKFTASRTNLLFQNWEFNAANLTTPPAIIRRTAGTYSDINFYNIELDGASVVFSDTGSMLNTRDMGSMTIRNSHLHHCSTADGQPGCHAMYIWGNDNIVENNLITNVDGIGVSYYCSTACPFTGGIIRFNRIFDTTKSGILYGGAGSNGGTLGQVYGNVVYDTGSNGIAYWGISGSVYNNTIYSVTSTGIICEQWCSSSVVIRNNLSISNGTNCTTGSATADNNTCSGTDTDIFIDPTTAGSGKNLNLKEGSVAIAAGTQTGLPSGFTCVAAGSTCDLGAYQAPVRNKAVVEDAADTIYAIAFNLPTQSTRDNTGLQTCTVANFAVTVAGAGATESSCSIPATSTVEITLGTAVTVGQALTDAMTRSSLPTLKDNVNIGGTYAHVRTYSAAAGVNNVDGGALPGFTQSRFRFHQLRGTEASPVLLAAENTNLTLPRGAAFRLRVKFRTDDDPTSTGFVLRYDKDAAASYTVIPDTMGAAYIAWYGTTGSSDIPAAGTATTELLTSDEASNTACAVVRNSADFPLLDLNNSEAECEYVIQISNSVAVGTTYDFRVYKSDGTALDTYSVTPRLTIGSYIAGW